jgi:hypothetical protein
MCPDSALPSDDREPHGGTDDADFLDDAESFEHADDFDGTDALHDDPLEEGPSSGAQAELDDDDDPELMDAARGLAGEVEGPAAPATVAGQTAVAIAYVGDADAIGDLPQEDRPGLEDHGSRPSEDASVRARRIGAELNQLEVDVREILDAIDPRRKRKLSGTRRWHELQEDIIQWRFTSRVDESALKRLNELVARRHYLFRQLEFLSVTRPTWNS